MASRDHECASHGALHAANGAGELVERQHAPADGEEAARRAELQHLQTLCRKPISPPAVLHLQLPPRHLCRRPISLHSNTSSGPCRRRISPRRRSSNFCRPWRRILPAPLTLHPTTETSSAFRIDCCCTFHVACGAAVSLRQCACEHAAPCFVNCCFQLGVRLSDKALGPSGLH